MRATSLGRNLPRIVVFLSLIAALIGSAAPGAPAAPLAACAPRPAVGVAVVPGGAGALQVTITATTNGSTPTNQLTRLQFGAASGALIDVPGQPAGQPGSFTVVLAASTTQTSFTVRQAVAGQAATVPLTVTDSCGDWPTLVGGGPSAFPTATPGAGPSPTPTGTPTPVKVTSLSVGLNSLGVGTPQPAAWSNIPAPTTLDWIGLFVPGASNSDYLGAPRFTGSTAPNGSTNFVIPSDAAADNYELRLFSDKSTTRLATSPGFAVTRPGPTPTFTPTPGVPPPVVVAPVVAPDTVGNVGQFTAVALDEAGIPAVSYYDVTNQHLKVLRCANQGCTAVGTITAPDTGGNVGQFTSLKLDANDVPVISYFDATNGHLKLVHCSNLACSGGQPTLTVDGSPNTGQYTSLALDAGGNPVVSYYDAAQGHLKVLHCTNPACSALPANFIAVPDAAGNVGQYTSLQLDSGGRPVVSYYDVTNQALKLLHCGNANCTAGNSVVTVDAIGNVGQHTSLALDVLGNPVISYYDATNQRLKVAHCGDVNCANPAVTIAPDAFGNVGQFTALRLDQLGRPVISYYDATFQRLKLLHCGSPSCTAGNTLYVVDGGNVLGTGNVGQFTALVMDVTDNPVLSYYDVTNGDLKVKHCSSATCITTPDEEGDVGRFTALRLDASGNPVVSYYDATNGQVKVLHCGDQTCSFNNTINTPDFLNDNGRGSALALDGSGNPVVSYLSAATSASPTGNLRLVHCGDPACGSGAPVTLDNSGNVGPYTSVAVAAGNVPVVSYYDQTNGDLKVVRCNDANCATSSTATPDSGGDVGRYNSLRLDGSGNPVISYYDATNHRLKVLHCGSPACTVNNTITLPDSGADIGQFSSLVLDASGNPVVSYYDATNHRLKLLHCGNPTCTQNNTAMVVDAGGDVGQFSSVALDPSGRPVISYYDATNGDLKVAHCVDASCSGGAFAVAVDTIGNVGQFTSAAVLLGGGLGFPVVSYYDVTNANLKVVRCLGVNCN